MIARSMSLCVPRPACSVRVTPVAQVTVQAHACQRRVPGARHRVRCCATDGNDGDGEAYESAFQRELKRRGIPNSGAESAPAPPSGGSSDARSPFGEQASARSPFTQTKQTKQTGPMGQLDRSRALAGEGLEGLIPRGSQLLQLGGSFFLAFVPFIIGIILLTGSLYVGFGDKFVHGSSASLPSYQEPYDLLNEPTVDPYYPIN